MNARNPVRVRLDEEQFRRLCAGQAARLVSHRGDVVELILADIGGVAMLRAVLDGAFGGAHAREAESGC